MIPLQLLELSRCFPASHLNIDKISLKGCRKRTFIITDLCVTTLSRRLLFFWNCLTWKAYVCAKYFYVSSEFSWGKIFSKLIEKVLVWLSDKFLKEYLVHKQMKSYYKSKYTFLDFLFVCLFVGQTD